jgi:hypothetical protein
MIEAPVSRRGLFALWCDRGGGRFQSDLSAGSLKATRRQVRRFARTGMKCPETVDMARNVYKMADPGGQTLGRF